MNCPKCKVEAKPGGKFCTRCGTKLVDAAINQEEEIVKQLVTFLQQYKQTHDINVLRSHLLQQGYTSNAVEKAVSQVYGPISNAPHIPRISSNPPIEAVMHYRRAVDNEPAEGDLVGQRTKASELALAIQKANGPFPTAHAELGYVFYMLGDEKRAREEWSIAIGENRNHVYARGLIILANIDKLGVPGFLSPKGQSLIADILAVGGGLAVVQQKITNLSREVDELTRAYLIYLSEFSNTLAL